MLPIPARWRAPWRWPSAMAPRSAPHISYPDLMGFGRRRMELSESEVYEISVYQIGALLGFCRAEGVPPNHVKPTANSI
jgi:UPF0271 protein